jgi:hypothetical protein
LSRIERGEDGWQGTASLLERFYPTRCSKPEIQLKLNNTHNQTVNAFSITIRAEEYRQLEALAEPNRAGIKEMFAKYKLVWATATRVQVDQSQCLCQQKFANYCPRSGT